MSHARRAVACASALTVALLSFAVSASAVDPASQATAAAAVSWLVDQQQPDGGFEVAAFPGFETLDATIAIAANAQTGGTWSTSEAVGAVEAVQFGGAGPTPFAAIDAYAETIPTLGPSTAGTAAKNIVLGASPYGFDPTAFDPAADGTPVDLVSLMGGCSATGSTTFNFTLYIVVAQSLVCPAPSAAALTTIRDAQQADGGWNFLGDPTGTDIDPDTTGLAVQALVAGGADASDAALRAALGFFAANQQANGSWQAFGADDPNSTSTAIFGITAAGFDVESPCWRDTVDASRTGTAYASPTAWLRSQQLTSPPSDAGRIASPNDGFGVNTFATSQSVQGLLQSWLPIMRAPQQTCGVPASGQPVEPLAPLAVATTPRFTG
jgi:hypothetical protein